MDINARINWMPGMELTSETFSGMAEQWDFRQQLAIRAALGSNRMGLVPGAPFSCNGTFVKNRFEVTGFQCMALLPSGRIVNAEEDVELTIPMLFGDKYYLTVGFGDDHTEFEKKGVPFVKPHYAYTIHTIEEIEADMYYYRVRAVCDDGYSDWSEWMTVDIASPVDELLESSITNVEIYDLSGRRLHRIPPRGIYIQSGKVHLVR